MVSTVNKVFRRKALKNTLEKNAMLNFDDYSRISNSFKDTIAHLATDSKSLTGSAMASVNNVDLVKLTAKVFCRNGGEGGLSISKEKWFLFCSVLPFMVTCCLTKATKTIN